MEENDFIDSGWITIDEVVRSQKSSFDSMISLSARSDASADGNLKSDDTVVDQTSQEVASPVWLARLAGASPALRKASPIKRYGTHRLIYVSAASVAFSKQDLLRLLDRCRTNNDRLGLTGMLLYKDGDFIQLIEGDLLAVQEVFAAIKKDTRHRFLTVILEESADHRLFEDWSMGFRDLDDPDVHGLPGYSPYMNSRFMSQSFQQSPEVALQLLSLFKPDR